jgi:uncharacterized membrane protein YhiD involved in acid resistance
VLCSGTVVARERDMAQLTEAARHSSTDTERIEVMRRQLDKDKRALEADIDERDRRDKARSVQLQNLQAAKLEAERALEDIRNNQKAKSSSVGDQKQEFDIERG